MNIDPTVTCPAGSLRYVWRSGDTVKSVAKAFGTTVSAMVETNPGVDFSNIQEGVNVCVPSRALTCPNADLYAIQKGDTFYDLAKVYGVSTETLLEMNPYVEPTRLSIGQYICVPKRKPDQPAPVEPPRPAEPPVPPCEGRDCGSRACAAIDIVRCGETVYDVLVKYGITFAEFAALNPSLARKPLYPGQKYYYPLRACACGPNGRYTMRPKDTVHSVAASLGISASELMRRNPHLKPGDFVAGKEICLTYSAK